MSICRLFFSLTLLGLTGGYRFSLYFICYTVPEQNRSQSLLKLASFNARPQAKSSCRMKFPHDVTIVSGQDTIQELIQKQTDKQNHEVSIGFIQNIQQCSHKYVRMHFFSPTSGRLWSSTCSGRASAPLWSRTTPSSATTTPPSCRPSPSWVPGLTVPAGQRWSRFSSWEFLPRELYLPTPAR